MDIKALRGLSGTYNVRASERDKDPSRTIECLVQFLDNTQRIFTIDRRCKGQALLDQVFKHLDLIETDFFGLKFIPPEAIVSNDQTKSSTNLNISSNARPSTPIEEQVASSSSASSTSSAIVSSTNVIDNNNHTDLKNISKNNVINCATKSKCSNNKNSRVSDKTSNITATNDDIRNLKDDRLQIIDPTFDYNHNISKYVWLDPTKSIKKQYKSRQPYRFYFRVKFYVSDPCKLADDTTRHHLYQQLRLDIFNDRLAVPTCSAILLASYILQSEVGDYKHELSENGYVSNFRLLPEQSDDFKKKVIELHKQHKSLSSADAEYQFLEHAAKTLDCYGVEFYEAQDSNDMDVRIGVSSNGIIVFRNGKKINQFSWVKIMKIMFKKKIFSIQLKGDTSRGSCDSSLEFNLLTNQSCKLFWEECVAQHSFFRLHQPKSPPKNFFSFLNFGSKFQYSGKTEYQTMEESKKRSYSHFSRTPSKRYARTTLPIGRPSWNSATTSVSQSNQPSETTIPMKPCNSDVAHHHNNITQDYHDHSSASQQQLRTIVCPNDTFVQTNGYVNQRIFDAANNRPVGFSSPPQSSSSSPAIKDHVVVNVSDYPTNSSTSKGTMMIPVATVTSATSTIPPVIASYRPQSLTIKSFMYIDEQRSVKSPHHGMVSPGSASTQAYYSDTGDHMNAIMNGSSNVETNGKRDELKRCESLRISNSIKGALNLTKKAGVSSSNQLARISESLRDKFSSGKLNQNQIQKTSSKQLECSNVNNGNSTSHEGIHDCHNNRIQNNNNDDDDLDLDATSSESNLKVVRLTPGHDGRYGFKIRKISSSKRHNHHQQQPHESISILILKYISINKRNKKRSIIIDDVSPNSPAAISEPRLVEGDEIIKINGISIDGKSESEVGRMIKEIQKHPGGGRLTLEVDTRFSICHHNHNNNHNNISSNGCNDSSPSTSFNHSSDLDARTESRNSSSNNNDNKSPPQTLAESIRYIRKSLDNRKLVDDFEKLSRKKQDETSEESKLMENIDKNRYQDILPYDSTRVQLIDSMTGDYINASFVDIPVPSGTVNRYIATQGPLGSTCDDFWQMIWEQNTSLIIMVTPLVEAGRVKCHKYWPDEKEEVRHGQILIRNLSEKTRAATIDRTIQLVDVKSKEKRITTQIQYKAWPDHEVPEDCSDFLKLVNKVRKHRSSYPKDPIVVHCSAGIGRTGVLILMETAICIMESGEPIDPIKILEDMRKQRAMLIQTNSQFQFVAEAICKVYDQKLYKK